MCVQLQRVPSTEHGHCRDEQLPAGSATRPRANLPPAPSRSFPLLPLACFAVGWLPFKQDGAAVAVIDLNTMKMTTVHQVVH